MLMEAPGAERWRTLEPGRVVLVYRLNATVSTVGTLAGLPHNTLSLTTVPLTVHSQQPLQLRLRYTAVRREQFQVGSPPPMVGPYSWRPAQTREQPS